MFVYTTATSVAEFLDKFRVLKADANHSFFQVQPCSSAETICLSWSPSESPFFYMYACLFADLHVSLPFDDFTVGILKMLNVAPTQLHPNTWASIQTFCLTCDVLCFYPTPSCFLSYYTSHPAKLVLWYSLINRSGNIIFPLSLPRTKDKKSIFSRSLTAWGQLCIRSVKIFHVLD